MRVKILNGKVDKDRKDSFWYRGDIACIGNYYLIASGDIRVNFQDDSYDDKNNGDYYDTEATEEAWRRDYNDKDIHKWSFENNNWFEVVYVDDNQNIIDSTMGDVAYEYDEGIRLLKQYYKAQVYKENEPEEETALGRVKRMLPKEAL